MWRLVQSGLSVVAGTTEPEYGPEAIHPVFEGLQEGDALYSDLSLSDLSYQAPNHTNVETQTFYFEDSVHSGFAQIIHSNVVGLHTTAQFTFKLFKKTEPADYIWTSTKLDNFRTDGANFYADNCSIEINDTLDTYTIKSTVTKESEVELVIKRQTQGVKFGKDGTTYYGTDLENPWGSMRHVFWPRCDVNGTIKLGAESQQDGEEKIIEIKDGLSMFVMALQGMKPHHAAATWNFLNYQSEKYSVVIMEFTTPKAYATTTVSVGIVTDASGNIIFCSKDNKVEHLETKVDKESGWNVPTKISFKLHDKDKIVEVCGDLTHMSERVDVMAEIPQFVKNIVSGVAGTKPYIYQFSNDCEFKLYENGEIKDQEIGYTYNEATFITEI